MCKYPDFCVDQYWGANNATNLIPDIIRIVVEVGSVGNGTTYSGVTKDAVEEQVHKYMELVGSRWQGLLFGLGILGNEVYIAQMRDSSLPGGRIRRPRKVWDGDGWKSMFDREFFQELDRMYDYCMLHEGVAGGNT